MKKIFMILTLLLAGIAASGQQYTGKKVTAIDSLVADTIRARTQAGVWIQGLQQTDPAGNNTEIQFNDNGVFGASSNLIWDGDGLEVDNIRLNSFTIRPTSGTNAAITIRGGASGDTDGFISPKGSTETSNAGGVSFGSSTNVLTTMSSSGDWDFNTNSLTDIGSITVDDLTLNGSTISTSGTSTLLLQTANNLNSDIDLQTTNVNSSIRFLNNSGGVEFKYTNVGNGLFDFQQGTLGDIEKLTVENLSFQDSLIVVDAVTSVSFDAENNVSIPNGGLDVEDSISNGNSYVHLRSELGTLNIDQLFSSPNDIVMQIDNNNNGSSDAFTIYNDGSATDPTSGTQIFNVSGAGDVSIPNGDLSIGSNKLADVGSSSASDSFYESGTFTPTLYDGSDTGTANLATTFVSAGRYRRVGSVVYFFLRLVNINTSGLTAGADIYIHGFPYSSDSGHNYQSTIMSADVSFDTSSNLLGYFDANNSYMRISENTTTSRDFLIVSEITSGTGDIWVQGFYFTGGTDY